MPRIIAKSTKRTAHWHIAFRVPHNRLQYFPQASMDKIAHALAQMGKRTHLKTLGICVHGNYK